MNITSPLESVTRIGLIDDIGRLTKMKIYLFYLLKKYFDLQGLIKLAGLGA
jgi:hypothetical protein